MLHWNISVNPSAYIGPKPKPSPEQCLPWKHKLYINRVCYKIPSCVKRTKNFTQPSFVRVTIILAILGSSPPDTCTDTNTINTGVVMNLNSFGFRFQIWPLGREHKKYLNYTKMCIEILWQLQYNFKLARTMYKLPQTISRFQKLFPFT
jgi:hypothetical protein